MSARVKISSKLPGEESINGIDHLADTLTDDPDGTILCSIVWWDVRDVRDIIATGERVPTVQIRRIEAFPLDETPDAVREVAALLFEKRTNRTPLPFDQLEADNPGATASEGFDEDFADDQDEFADDDGDGDGADVIPF